MVTIKTGADALLEYVQQHGETPLRQAAKALDQPASTIEAWARFLEEEGLLKFKYTFTQVNLLPAKRTAKQMAATIAEEETVSAQAQEMATNLGKWIEQARSAMRDGNLAQAARVYGQIQRLCESMSASEAADAQPLLEQLSAVSTQFAGTAEKMINQLIKSVQSNLRRSDVLNARSLFDQARALVSWVPPHEQKRRIAMQVRLIEAQKKLVAKEFDYYAKDFRTLRALIDKTLGRARQALEGNDLIKANELYQQLMTYKDRLPVGFLAERAAVETKILNFYSDLSVANIKQAEHDFEQKAQQLNQVLSMARDYVNQKRTDDALAAYDQARHVFAQLPQGFSEKALPLEQSLLEVSKICLTLHSESVQSKAEKILKSADELLRRTREKLRQDDLVTARGLANELANLYNSFPHELAQERARFKSNLKSIQQMLDASGA